MSGYDARKRHRVTNESTKGSANRAACKILIDSERR